MSLFNDSEKTAKRKRPWTEFEMEQFEPPLLTKSHAHPHPDPLDSGGGEKKDKDAFISLPQGEKERGDFISLHEGEDNHTKRKEAEDILKEAKKRVDLLEQEAYEKGFAQGEKDGLELGEKKAIKMIENMENLFIEIGHLRKDILKQHEREILELIFAITKKIIHDQAGLNEDNIKNTVFQALDLTAVKNEIILKINPEDCDLIEALRPSLFTTFKELKSITVTSDPCISRGGCLLETPHGDVDATLETRLEKIYQAVEGVRKLETWNFSEERGDPVLNEVRAENIQPEISNSNHIKAEEP